MSGRRSDDAMDRRAFVGILALGVVDREASRTTSSRRGVSEAVPAP